MSFLSKNNCQAKQKLKIHFEINQRTIDLEKSEIFKKRLQILQHWGLTLSLYNSLFDMIFSPEGVVSAQDYEYKKKLFAKWCQIRTIDLEQLRFYIMRKNLSLKNYQYLSKNPGSFHEFSLFC